jgi:hypothetical protein
MAQLALLIFDIADFMQIFGVTLVLLGLAFLPVELHYKKTRGSMPRNMRMGMYAGLGVASLLIAITVQMVWFSDRRDPHEAIRKIAEQNNGQLIPPQFSTPTLQPQKHKQLTDAERTEREAERQRRAELEAEQDAEIERQRAEREAEMLRMRQQHEAEMTAQRAEAERRHAEAKAKFEATRRMLEALREARANDFYAPPPASITPEQIALDEQIVAGNAELQQMKAEKNKLDAEYQAAREKISELYKSRPVDTAAANALRESSNAARTRAFELGREISTKRNEVSALFQQRYKMIDPVTIEP